MASGFHPHIPDELHFAELPSTHGSEDHERRGRHKGAPTPVSGLGTAAGSGWANRSRVKAP